VAVVTLHIIQLTVTKKKQFRRFNVPSGG